MKRRLVISKRARADLIEIWLYTCKKWGAEQADRYLDALDAGLRECAAEPECGRRRDEVRPGCWSLLVRRHVAFYSVVEDEVRIQRVLHGSMDPNQHMDDE